MLTIFAIFKCKKLTGFSASAKTIDVRTFNVLCCQIRGKNKWYDSFEKLLRYKVMLKECQH